MLLTLKEFDHDDRFVRLGSIEDVELIMLTRCRFPQLQYFDLGIGPLGSFTFESPDDHQQRKPRLPGAISGNHKWNAS